jgi:hypothetical protein
LRLRYTDVSGREIWAGFGDEKVQYMCILKRSQDLTEGLILLWFRCIATTPLPTIWEVISSITPR